MSVGTSHDLNCSLQKTFSKITHLGDPLLSLGKYAAIVTTDGVVLHALLEERS